MTTGDAVDTAFVEVELKMDSLEKSIRDMENSVTVGGKRAGEGFKTTLNDALKDLKIGQALNDGSVQDFEGDLKRLEARLQSELSNLTQGTDAYRERAQQLLDVRAEMDKLGESGSGAGSKIQAGLGGAMKFVGGAAVGMATAVASAVAGAVVAGAKGALDIAAQANQGLLDFQAQLGASAEEAQRYGEQAKEVFGSNWGESLTEAQGMIIEVRKQMKGLADDDLTAATKNAAALADTFGTEVGEQASAAETLMKNFSLTSQQAFDFLAKGYQDGLNSSGDFLDTIGEYSTQFKNGGATAEQFFSLLQTGIQGGVLGTDKAADAFKEFTVRIQDGSKTTSDGLKSLGIDAEALGQKMASGQVTSADAFQLVLEKLRGVKDENLRMQAGVALLGTQFEDLGKSGALALDLTKAKMTDLNGATDKVQARYNNLGQMMQGVWRQTLLQLEPVGQQLLGLANDAMPYVQAAIKQLGPVVSQVVTALVGGMNQAKGSFSSVAPVVQQSFGVVKSVIATLAPYIVTVFNGVKPVVQSLGPLFSAVFTLVGQVWNTVLKPVLTTMAPFFSAQFGIISAVVKAAVGIVTGVLQTVSAFMRGDVSGAARALNGAFDKAAAGIGQAMRDGAAQVMRALGSLPAQVVQIAQNIIAGLVNGIRNGVSQIGAAARDMASGFLDNVKKSFGIQSPSRVMATLGVFTAQSFVNGINNQSPYVQKSAKDLSAAFMNEFKTLNLEQIAGSVNLTTYVKTLTDAKTALQAKLKSVDQGSAAYQEYLTALTQVQKALDGAKGKTQAQTEAQDKANKALAQGQAAINKTERIDALTKAFDGMTEAQLRGAMAAAKAAGDTVKYNAARKELETRENEAAKATEKAASAHEAAQKKIADNRAQIEATEAAKKYATGLQSATDAQLKRAAASAKASGDVDKWNAIAQEQERREKAVEAATKKRADAQAQAAKQLADNKAQINASEQAERYRVILDNATDAQLRNALEVAKSKGEVEKYNAIKAEQKQREDAARTAAEKAAAAQKQHADQIAANRKQIQDGLNFDAYVKGLKDYDDAQLNTARSNAIAAGDVQKFNAVVSEQKRRVDEVQKAEEAWTKNLERIASGEWTKGLQSFTDEQLRGALATAVASKNVEQYNAVLAEQGRRTDEAKKNSQAWTDNLQKIQSGVWAKSLKDMTDEQLNFNLATAVAGQNVEEYNQILTEQARRADEAAKVNQAWSDNLTKQASAGFAAGLRDYTAEMLSTALAVAVSAKNVEQFNAVTAEQQRRLDEAGQKVEDWNKNLDKIGEGNWAKSLKDLGDEQLRVALNTAEASLNVDQYNAVLAEMQRRTDDAAKSAQTWADNLNKVNFSNWTSGLKNMTDAELSEMLASAAAAQNIDEYNAILAEQSKRLDDATKKHNDWVTNLDKIAQAEHVESLKGLSDAELEAALSAAAAAENTDEYNAILAVMKGRVDDATKAEEAWQAVIDKQNAKAYADDLQKLSDSQLAFALEAASAAKNVETYTAILAEMERRTKEVADAQKLIKDSTAEVNAALNKGEQPWAKQIAALQAAKGKSKELDAQIDELIASMQKLQAQTAQQAGFDTLKQKIGQVGDIVQKTFAMFGADAEIQQGIGQLTAGIQDGVEAFAKFSSGDILGGIQAALSGIMNIGNAIENLDPGIKAWKKGLLEVAAIEKEMVGARKYGNVNNPYYDTLMKDAAERERAGNSKWYQRLGWSLFGGAPQYMSDEAAKFMAKSAEIFGDVAEAVVGGLDSALMNAFNTGDWTGAEEAMAKSLDQMVAKMALQAIIAGSKLQAQIQAYAEARNRALEDGVIDAQEQANLDVMIGNIKAEQKRIAQEWRSTAETLPGYGADGRNNGANSTAQDGSIKALEEDLANLRQQFDSVTSDTEREKLRGQITALEAQLKALRDGPGAGLDTITSSDVSAKAPTATRIDANVAQILDMNGYIKNLSEFNTTLLDITPRWEALTTRFDQAVMRFESLAMRGPDWTDISKQ